MAFAVTLKKLANSGIQTVFAVTHMGRPGNFPKRPQQMGADMAPCEPPEGQRGWFPVGVDTKTPGYVRKK